MNILKKTCPKHEFVLFLTKDREYGLICKNCGTYLDDVIEDLQNN